MNSSPRIQNFLVALSDVAGINLELKDRDGRVVMSSVLPPDALPTSDPAGCRLFAAGIPGFRRGQAPLPQEKNPPSLAERETSPAVTSHSIEGVCEVPIEKNGDVIASLSTCGFDPKSIRFIPTSDGDSLSVEVLRERFLKPVAGIIQDTLALQQENEKIVEELSESFEMIHMYGIIAKQLRTLRFSGDRLSELLGEAISVIRADLAFSLFINCNTYDTVVSPKGPFSGADQPVLFARQLIRTIPPGASLLEKGVFVLDHSGHSEAFRPLHPNDYRFLVVPIMQNTSVRGFLGVVSFNMKEKFRRAEMRMLMSLAEQMGLAISNTEMIVNLENLIINLVKSFVMAIEAKDPYTRGHSERVNHYCKLMADELGMSKEEKTNLEWASILHDLGKIGINENILNKPGRLTNEEFNVIKEHPQKGCSILQPIVQLTQALPGILHHHERYDGGGYPQGLAGEAIPAAARIIAVADTFDAISSNRAYRSAKPREKALEIVKEVAGTQLDPNYVAVFETVCRKHQIAS